jgi:hypothetical protein
MAQHPMTRRTFLIAGAALGIGTTALGGCKGGGTKTSGINLLPVTPAVPSGKAGRLVFVLMDDDRETVTPKKATIRFGRSPDTIATQPIEVDIRTDAAPAATYLLASVELSPPGTVYAEVIADGKKATASFEIVDRIPGVGAGDPLPSVKTPSGTDLAGMEVACTRQPACPLHDVSLDAALARKRPLAVLVASPAFCQTAVCGPVLDVLLKAMPAFADRVDFLHLEVYAQKPHDTIEGTPLAPAVKGFGLESEPTLYLVGADGVVRNRIDGVMGTGEVTQALTALTA